MARDSLHWIMDKSLEFVHKFLDFGRRFILMDNAESGAGRSTPAETEHNSLIPGLPDDVSSCCIARVPRRYHDDLIRVSKRWRDLVRSEEWLDYRQKHGLQETWIYSLCRGQVYEASCYVLDPSAEIMCWKLISDKYIMSESLGFEVLGKKLYILSGQLKIFDTTTNTCSDGPYLSNSRFYFGCMAFNGKMYVIGGLNLLPYQPGALPCEVYDPGTNTWTYLFDNNIFRHVCDAVVMEGKIFVRGPVFGYPEIRVAAYDPSSNMWQLAYPGFASGWTGSAVIIDGTLYMMDSLASGFRKWDKERRIWVEGFRMPILLRRGPCQVVAIGRTVYVIGSDLSTVIIDLDDPANQDSITVYSCIGNPIKDDHRNSGCRCVAL